MLSVGHKALHHPAIVMVRRAITISPSSTKTLPSGQYISSLSATPRCRAGTLAD
ncbi:hypothetical protein ACULNC_15460 [Shigella flexneri]